MRSWSKARRGLALLLGLCLALTGAACGGAKAGTGTMRLMKTEGEVKLSQAEKELELQEQMLLDSGCRLETGSAGHAWINLDENKLCKLDEESRAVLNQEGRALELEPEMGRLFFRVTKPLEIGESLEIRCASMAMVIRGTCGWVEAPDGEHMKVYILEGTVECGVTDSQTRESVSASVSAGEYASLSIAPEESTLEKGYFQAGEIPAFALDELPEDLAGTVFGPSEGEKAA